jgi:hypothetical protein
MYATAAGAKRNRQLGQHTGVIPDPFHRSLKDESTPSPVSHPTDSPTCLGADAALETVEPCDVDLLLHRLPATFALVPAGLRVPDSGLVGAHPWWFPATASVGAVFVYHGSSIWMPDWAASSTRRAGTIEPAHTGVNTVHGSGGSGSRRRPGRRRLTGPALKPTERWARVRAASSKLRWS